MFPRTYHEGSSLTIYMSLWHILSSYCIVNLAEYLDATWIEGIHIFKSFVPFTFQTRYEHWNIWLVGLDSISVYIKPSPVSPERSPGSSVKRCHAKLVGGGWCDGPG